ncbi:hypothetical protein V6N13_014366 [Hibiscus sabdariffa]|uniref:Uncharacterized protein n=1 Tax=Hibiscus sabdariffa TaxID=183260 RepID=A0ABR2RV23_9ROSI
MSVPITPPPYPIILDKPTNFVSKYPAVRRHTIILNTPRTINIRFEPAVERTSPPYLMPWFPLRYRLQHSYCRNRSSAVQRTSPPYLTPWLPLRYRLQHSYCRNRSSCLVLQPTSERI